MNAHMQSSSIPDKYVMDGHKLMWHPGRVADWLDRKRIAPIYIDMGITQTCNIQCKYCYYSVPENRTNQIIPTESLITFLKDAAEIGVKAIGFLGDGEPMVHSGVYEAVIEGAKAGLDMALSTNGLIMKDDKLKEFLESLTWIRFNLSAATPEKYAEVMGTKPEMFNKVIKNLKKCISLKKQYNLKTTIGLQMVLIEECAGDIVPFAKLGKDLGVDYAVIKQCSESDNHKLNLSNKDYQKFELLLREAMSYSDDKYNMIVKWKKMLKSDVKKYDRCLGCEFLPQISGNGDVYNCGNFFGNKEYYIGNITEQSFKDIVFGERYKTVMEKVKNNTDVHAACGTKCRQNEINEFLWKIIHPPEHTNFV